MIYISKTSKRIAFTFFGQEYLHAKKWIFNIDQMVFREQLETGCRQKNGQKIKIHANDFELMQRAQALGGTLPVYGVGGERGIQIFRFWPEEDLCHITVDHEYAVNPFFKSFPPQIADGHICIEDPRTSCIGFDNLSPENLDLTLRAKDSLLGRTFVIAENVYDKLCDWSHWDDQLALSGRYIYSFPECSIGTTPNVIDCQTGISIDIADFEML